MKRFWWFRRWHFASESPCIILEASHFIWGICVYPPPRRWLTHLTFLNPWLPGVVIQWGVSRRPGCFGKKPNPGPRTWFLLKPSKQGGQRMSVEHWVLRAPEDSRINLLSFIREKQLEGKSWRNAEMTKEARLEYLLHHCECRQLYLSQEKRDLDLTNISKILKYVVW